MSEPALHIEYPPELPISQRRDDIARAIRDNQVVIVAGATGSGKTTQLPKILLELGMQSIGHTQPRRIAARTIAERIAEELGQEVGQTVGFQIRFTDKVGAATKIKLMTDGILLNEIHRDRDLKKYDAIIIDEAHERSLTVDFLLGYLKQLLPRRPELKVVITSATIDPESFSQHFNDAPIIEVSGRTYPVEIRYRPLVGEDRDYLEGITDALDELAKDGNGDVLVFLSGEAEIRDATDAIRGRQLAHTEVLPLFGRLSSADQHKVFQRPTTAGRRIILATNVAETSLTVPGIRYVIDAGTARISRYSVRSKIQRLPIEAISQASANQRSGRSGRTSDGIAIRLYSEEDFAGRPEFTDPEILRTNLAAVILQMISLGLGDIASFPFLQPPDSRGIKDGLDLLRELGAIAERETATQPAITAVGKQIAQLPLDPRLARMVIESKKHGTTREIMAIVAGLSILDPRERPLDKRSQADQQHARFIDPTSDFLTLLNLWNYLEQRQKELSGNQFRRMCKAEFVNYLRVREWQDVYRQLARQAKPLGLTIGEPAVNPDGIHRSLLAGLLSHIGLKDAAKRDYVGARQSRFTIFPGSALAKKQPNAVMSAELVETSRLFARMNASIDPEWAEPIAGDLVKRTYGEPHWEQKQGSAVAYERVTLFGVPIVAKRRVQFSRIDLPYARELFIRHALVDGEWDLDRLNQRLVAFDRANRALRAQLEEIEERTRRRDILHDDEAIFRFYDRRIAPEVASTRDFEGWWKKARIETPGLLTMTVEDLVDDVESVDEQVYPSEWHQGSQTLSLSYRFEPGAPDDGVTVTVPVALLAGLSASAFDWQVPGLREDLVIALLKTLPKQIRREVVPAADWARKLLANLPAVPDGNLLDRLASEIRAQTHTAIAATDFEPGRVPAHLRVSYAVVNENGETVASSKTLSALQATLKPKARESVARASVTPRSDLERSGLTSWDFDSLPPIIDTKHPGGVVRAYPALVDERTSVAIRLMSTAEDQAVEMRAGIRRMLLLAIPAPIAYVQEHLTSAEKLAIATSPYRSNAAMFEDCMVACIDAAIDAATDAATGSAPIFTRVEFELVRDRVSSTIIESLFDTVAQLSRVLLAAREVDKAITSASSISLMAPLADAREQLSALVYPGFVSATGIAQLRRIPVYLAGITHRVTKLAENPGRDRQWLDQWEEARSRYVSAGGELPPRADATAHLRHARWMLEEFRLSLFAQQLPTAEPVSLQRISKVLSSG